ncbi:hypothetical protein SASPL_130830 [Salvia splendens]|uniref:Uncharacterized protein n=1 Tax=Salvia splendens TaxID=180675 RepID=A0A8X8ZKB0_SALSN|nr:hypothetical protein SASPL_130830 [Salvia splendens]
MIHDWFPVVFPHLEQWRNEYELVKEISLCTSLNLGKPSYLSTERGPLLGRGILSSNGPYWAHQRKIVAPEFYLERVEVQKAFNKSRSDVEVDTFLLCRLLGLRCMVNDETTLNKHLPTKYNRELWRLEPEIDSMILGAVKSRSSDDDNDKKDLLQLLLATTENERDDSNNIPADKTPTKFIVDNYKNIYLAGHETTSISASWCMMMLAAHPDWKARSREEVLEIYLLQ